MGCNLNLQLIFGTLSRLYPYMPPDEFLLATEQKSEKQTLAFVSVKDDENVSVLMWRDLMLHSYRDPRSSVLE